jgi:hypothetical protein
MNMNRRQFMKNSVTAAAVVAVGSMADWPVLWRSPYARATSVAGSAEFELEMVEVDAQMVDTVEVPMWAFRIESHEHDGHSQFSPRIPGPALVALEGDRIRLKIKNSISQGGDHGFAIPGVTLTSGGQEMTQVIIPRNEDLRVEFSAPAPGTYMYLDPLNAPVNRVMGLHGALVVLPHPVGGNGTPYRNPTANIQRLFDDLGRTAHFPGHPWDLERNTVWVFNTIDPGKCRLAAGGTSAISPSAFESGFLPQYFTLNGKTGFFATQHHHFLSSDADHEEHHHTHGGLSIAQRLFDAHTHISINGRVGQPILIRNLNAGLAWHSPHIHGNHVYQLTDAGNVPERDAFFLDTWTVPPMARIDLLLAYVRPPDIPGDRDVIAPVVPRTSPKAWPPVEERFPLVYPMHDHNEISNTAAGGNYPHGLITHWQIDGDIDPREFVIFVDQADMRVRTGRIELKGRISRTPSEVGQEVILDVHVGGSDGETITRTIQVDAQGRWVFRGRGLKALSTRIVTLMFHAPGDPAMVFAARTVPLKLR